MRSDKQRLIDIQEAIIKIEKYTLKGKDIFMKDELIQTWMLYNLQIIGEAVRSISQTLKIVIKIFNGMIYRIFGIF